MRTKQVVSSLLLLLTAFIWGTAFVAQSSGMNYVGPFTFNCARSIIGALVLLPMALLSREKSESTKTLVFSAVLSGIFLAVASLLQQYGMLYTSVGKAGFLTALYVIIIPVIGIFMKKKCGINVWIAVFMAVLGVYLLCINEKISINKGDIMEFMCAFAYSMQILVISRYTSRVNVFRFACIQLLTTALISGALSISFEAISLSSVSNAWFPIFYAGVLSSGIAYTLQVFTQRELNPTLAAIIMSLEACFSALAGWAVLREILSIREIIGCIIMFAAIVLAQIKPLKKE